MGKGDKRSKKGKIIISSYGVSRPRPALVAKRKLEHAAAAPKASKAKASKASKPAAAKKTAKKKSE
jgi:ribosomal small subunit protein bTHX